MLLGKRKIPHLVTKATRKIEANDWIALYNWHRDFIFTLNLGLF